MKVLLTLCLSIIFSSAALADSYLFVGADFPGIFELDEEGKLQGVAVDILDEIASKTGHEIKYEIYPWSRALNMVESGQADAIIGPYRTPEREQKLTFNRYPFYQDQMVFFVKTESSFSWDGSLSSLQGVQIGVTKDWSYGQEFDAYKVHLDIHEAEAVAANFQRLLLSRIEVFASHQRAALVAINELNIARNVKVVYPEISVLNGYFGFSKQVDLNAFIEQFDHELKNIIDRDTSNF